MFFNLLLDNRAGSEDSFQVLTVSSVTGFASPEFVLNVIFLCPFHRRNQPSDTLKFFTLRT